MERRIAKKVESHVVGFKDAIREYIRQNKVIIVNQNTSQEQTSEFMKFVYDYDGVEFAKEDFQKRKRVKNVVPHCERCMAKRANGDQCTRRKSGDSSFCGTHAKGTPHGILTIDAGALTVSKKIEVWVEEIKGINYYIDNDGNVYKHEDVLNNETKPDIIAKWEVAADGSYSIPEYGI